MPTTKQEPVTVELGKLSTAAWIMVYVSPGARPCEIITPTAPEARGVLFRAAAPKLHVEIGIPLATAPSAAEPRHLAAAGLYDTRDLKALDGYGWMKDPATLARTRNGGIKVESGPLGARGLTISEESKRALAWVPPVYAAQDDFPVEEVTLDVLRTRFTADEGKGIPGTLLAALSVVDRVSPSAVKILRPPGLLVLTGQQDGVTFTVTMPREA